jgi:hypothetical protein
MHTKEEIEYFTDQTFANYAVAGKDELARLQLFLNDLVSLSDDVACAMLRRFHRIINDPKLWSEWRQEWREIFGFSAEGKAEVLHFPETGMRR